MAVIGAFDTNTRSSRSEYSADDLPSVAQNFMRKYGIFCVEFTAVTVMVSDVIATVI